MLMGKGTLAMEIGHTAANHLDNLLGDFVVIIADDNDILLIIKANGKGIAGFGHHEKGEEGIQHRLDAEEKDAYEKQAQIKNKARGADTDGIMLLDNGTDNIRAAAGAAHPIHAGRTNAVEHTARNAGQQLIVHHLIIREKMKSIQGNGKGHNAIQSADSILPIHIFIGQKKQGHVAD